ncbi:unnamed protein product [Gadus morhua 'NCC']
MRMKKIELYVSPAAAATRHVSSRSLSCCLRPDGHSTRTFYGAALRVRHSAQKSAWLRHFSPEPGDVKQRDWRLQARRADTAATVGLGSQSPWVSPVVSTMDSDIGQHHGQRQRTAPWTATEDSTMDSDRGPRQ